MFEFIKRVGPLLFSLITSKSWILTAYKILHAQFSAASKYATPLYAVYHLLASIPPKIHWRSKTTISDTVKNELATKLASGYYIILTGNKTHLSGIIVSLLSWIKTGKWAKYSHALMNCDNITDPTNRSGFKFVEATSKGVAYSTFDSVFECDTVCLLSPANVTNEEWTAIIDALVDDVGTPYDDLFDLADASRKSCVEVVLDALKEANYKEQFQHLDAMIAAEGNLVPQMYRDCVDFVVTFEA